MQFGVTAMKKYSVKEIYYTIQGEGMQTGRPAVFCRFSGCNLWTGREKDRAQAKCTFCDTDFVGTDGVNGGKYEAISLAHQVNILWPQTMKDKYVVCTGGEPLLQLDEELVQAFKDEGFEVAVETNGTIAAPPGIDWICVSPKPQSEIVQTSGQELKLVYPQSAVTPESVASLDFEYFFLQPMDGPRVQANTQAAIEYCLHHPQWRLSLQTHKFIGID